MSENRPIKNISFYFLMFIAPLLIAQCINFFLLHRDIFNNEYDVTLSFFSIGINFINGFDLTSFHQPATLFRELSGAIVRYALDIDLAHPDKAVENFALIGIYIHIAFVLFIAFWSAKILQSISDLKTTFLISFCIACCPGTVAFSTEFGAYYILALLMIPISLTISEFVFYERFRPWRLFSAYLILGLVISNYYLFLVTCSCLVLAAFLKVVFNFKKVSISEPKVCRSPAWRYISLGVVSAWFVLFNFYLVFVPALIGIWFYREHIKKAWKERGNRFLNSIGLFLDFILTPALLGMILGANKYSSQYFSTLIEVKRTYPAGPIIFSNFLSKLFFLGYWHLLLAVVILFFTYILLKNFGRGSVDGLQIISTVALITVVVSSFGIASYYSDAVLDSRFGADSRFILWSVPVVVFAILAAVILRKRAILAIIFSVSLASMGQFIFAHWGRAQDVDTFASRVDAHIDKFLNDRDDRVVVCFNDFFPSRYCTAAFAFNKYRGSDSKNAYNARWLYEKNIFWYDTSYFANNLVQDLGKKYKHILIVGWAFRFDALGRFYEKIPEYTSESTFSNDYKSELNTLGLKVQAIEMTKKD
jgi:hypothetical protein